VGEPMRHESFRKSFHYGEHADMQMKFLASMSDEEAADALAGILARLGETFDTGDLGRVRDAVYAAQVAAYAGDDAPTVEDAPFTPLAGDLAGLRLALVSAGGVFRVDDDPMGPDGPSQQESLGLIKQFLRGTATLSQIPKGTPDSALTARHPRIRRAYGAARPGDGLPARRAARARGRGPGAPRGHALRLHRRHLAAATAGAGGAAVGAAPRGRGRRRLSAGRHLTRLPRVGRTRRPGPRGRRVPTASVFVRAFAHVARRLRTPRVLVTPHLMVRTIGLVGCPRPAEAPSPREAGDVPSPGAARAGSAR
jgi:hypothetical protein